MRTPEQLPRCSEAYRHCHLPLHEEERDYRDHQHMQDVEWQDGFVRVLDELVAHIQGTHAERQHEEDQRPGGDTEQKLTKLVGDRVAGHIVPALENTWAKHHRQDRQEACASDTQDQQSLPPHGLLKARISDEEIARAVHLPHSIFKACYTDPRKSFHRLFDRGKTRFP